MTSHQLMARQCFEAYSRSDFEEANIEVTQEGNCFAFRGTDEPRDAVRDLRVLPWWNGKEIGWAPAGFAKGARRLLPKILSWCLEHDIDTDKGLEFCGHSLGGAIARLVAAMCVRDEVPVHQVVTFGAPRSGRLKILDATPVTQYRYGKDIVPLVPPIMRKHGTTLRINGPGTSFIKDHYMKNYLRMPKPPESG